jgi:uncharacterized protein
VKRIVAISLFLISCFLVVTGTVVAQTFPEPQGHVNDFASLLSAQGKQQLEDQLSRLEQETTIEIAVVTVNSLEGTTVEDYANRLFEKWGIGKKGKDNGVLLLVAKEERKVRIEVGYGLEAVLTDSRAGRILDNDVVPQFKQGNYEKGITDGVIAIETLLRYGTPPEPLEENPVKDIFDAIFSVVIFISIAGVYLLGFMARSKSVWLGSIFGAVAGVIIGLTIGGLIPLIVSPIVSAGFGAGLDFILSRNYRNRKASGSPTSWHKSWGGFSGGGSSGGFGGFGGGMSGGGGSSRGW